MVFTYESIQFNHEIPIRIFIHSINYVQNHWHDALEILFVLDGTIQLGMNNQVYTLMQEDLILINPNEIHTTSARGTNAVLALQIDKEWMNKHLEIQDTPFSCNSTLPGHVAHLEKVRNILAQMMWVYNNHSSHFTMKLQSYLLDLLHHFLLHFQADISGSRLMEQSEYMPRLSKIIHHIHENYAQNVTLQDLADQEYLSVSYISRFFKKHIGTTFKEYIIQLRLEHAVKDLLYTEKSISQLSFDHGFPNTNSFLDAFKETYKEAPSVYRKHFLQTQQLMFGNKKSADSYFDLENSDTFSSLYKYLNRAITWNDTDAYAPRQRMDAGVISLHPTPAGILLKHNWKNLLAVGKALDILNPHIQSLLTQVRHDLSVRYIRFHGIFDDEMGVYTEDEHGVPHLSFTQVDLVMDTLISMGLKPFLELGFMPSHLAASDKRVFDVRPSIISMPTELAKWGDLVTQLLSHCILRYGLDEVASWYVEIWNEPNILKVFWNDSQDDYHCFYSETLHAIRKASPRLQIVGPAVCNMGNMMGWMDDFLSYCTTNQCMPDAFSYHFYMHTGDLVEVQESQKSGFHSLYLSKDEDYFHHIRCDFQNLLRLHGCEDKPIHLSEWNASPAHTDLSRDTLFLSVYLAKHIAENYDLLDSYGFWTISDWIEEYPIPTDTFHGGLGLFTKNGIPKAGYQALRLLSRLGDEKIAAGPGYMVTKSDHGFHVLMYNYCHYDPLYCSMDHSGITQTDRYRVYHNYADKEIRLTLAGLPAATYEIVDSVINRESGSSFDAWVAMGAPEQLPEERIQYLKQRSEPGMTVMQEQVQHQLNITRLLTPLEVRLIEVVPL